MKLFTLTLVLFIVLSAFSAIAYTVYNDIEYYASGSAPQIEKNKLDIYVPDGAAANTPVFFFVHGGTWSYNDRADFVPIGTNLADDEGFVTVIPSFRLSDSLHPENVHPCHITDVAKAFAWTIENISTYNGDPTRVFLIGHSSGAHLATLLATNTSYLETAGGEVEDIMGVISLSMGIYDIPKLYYDCGMYGPMGYDMLGFNNIFGPLADSSTNWYDASPKYHLSAEMPPFLLFVAKEDLEWIIGGTLYGMISFDGEIQPCYNDMNVYHPTDSFWLDGDHDMILSDFAYYPTCRSRIETMDFVDRLLTGVDELSPRPAIYNLNSYPNPFNSAVTIAAPAGAEIEIYDVNGRMVAQLPSPSVPLPGGEGGNSFSHWEKVAEGRMRAFVWQPAPSLGSGVYLVRARADGGATVKRVVYLK